MPDSKTERDPVTETTIGGSVVKRARLALGLTRADFATELGYNGNSNTRHKTVFDIETGKRILSNRACDMLRELLAREGLAEQLDDD